jgi:pyrroline-5-carboxylate reductase
MMYEAGFIGCGNIGSVLAAVAAKSVGGSHIMTADHNDYKVESLRRDYGTVPATDQEVAAQSRFIFLGVKPQVMRRALGEIRETLEKRGEKERFVVVTMAAGFRMEWVCGLLGDCPVIRIMPNTPAAVGSGVIPYCVNEAVTEQDESDFLKLMRPAGMIERVEEGKMDMACAVTGCGPAFVCMFLEAMIDGAVRCGLPRKQAKLFALQTIEGTAKLALEMERDPAELRADVCSPAGSSIEGIAVLEQRAVRSAVIDAIRAAYNRTVELGKIAEG